MVTFNAHDTGTPAAAWADLAAIDVLPLLDLGGVDRIVVVAPHPDDETFGCGGVIAAASAQGIPVSIVVVTDGAASHPRSPTTTPARLRSLRSAEVVRAAARLGESVTTAQLTIPDGQTDVFRDEIERGIREETVGLSPQSMVLIPWVGDGHPDHRVVSEVVASVLSASPARTLQYPVWMWHWAQPHDESLPWQGASKFDLDSDARARKAAAMQEFGSQIEPLSGEPGDETVMLHDVLDHFRGDREVYFAVEGSTPVSQPQSRLEQDYFEHLYAGNDDPWAFQTRWYEQRKRALTTAALPRPRYGSVLEIGCSIGLLTEMLAERSDRVTATDISAFAVDAARERTADYPGVTVEQRDLAEGLPEGPFDLIVLSEVGYYLDEATLCAAARSLLDGLAADGEVLLCHWRHPVADYPLSGDQVHRILRAELNLQTVVRHDEKDLLLEVLSRDGRSVAEQTGLA